MQASQPTDNSEPPKNWRIPEWFQQLTKYQQKQLEFFWAELLRFNQRINLISKRTEADADLIHFSDSIMGSKILLESNSSTSVYDIGSGNGLPGIVLSVLAPERKVFLVDVDARKIEFQRYIISKLKLENCVAVNKRFEDLGEGSVHCAVSRGFGQLGKTLISARKPCAIEADYYHFKSSSWVREVASIPTQICSYWAPKLVEDYTLPLEGIKLSLIVTKRIG